MSTHSFTYNKIKKGTQSQKLLEHSNPGFHSHFTFQLPGLRINPQSTLALNIWEGYWHWPSRVVQPVPRGAISPVKMGTTTMEVQDFQRTRRETRGDAVNTGKPNCRMGTIKVMIILGTVIHLTDTKPVQLALPTLQAFDCSKPQDIREFSPNHMEACPTRKGQVHRLQPRRYQLLQREEFTTIPTLVCRRRYSKLEYYCGTYDHAAVSLGTTELDRPEPFTPEECRRMITAKTYRPKDTKHNITVPPNTEVQADYFVSGLDYLGTDDLGYYQVRCQNGYNTEHHIHLVTRRYDKISWQEHTLRWTRETDTLVDVAHNQGLGSCLVEREFCIIGATTYVWTNPKNNDTLRCPLAAIRETQAAEYIDTQMVQGENVTERHLVSLTKDAANFRLQLHGIRNECSRQIRLTQHDGLYVLPLEHLVTDTAAWGEPIPRALPDDNVKISLEVSQLASYTWYKLADQATKEFDAILEAECQMKQSKALTDHILEQTAPGLLAQTYRNGTFAARAGEVSYLYTCESVIVQPVEAEHCYDKLPVQFGDTSRILNLEGLKHINLTDAEKPRLFLTPGSRILTPIATEVSCTSLLPATYRGREGWFIANPHIVRVKGPDPLPVDTRTPNRVFEKENLTTGAVYETRAMEGLQRRLFKDQVKEAIAEKWADQVDVLRPEIQTPLGINNVFHNAQDFVKETAINSLFGPLKGFIQTFGMYGGVAVGLYYIYTALSWIVRLVLMQYQARGPGLHMLWGLPPLQHAFLHRFYRNQRRRRQADGPEEERPLPVIQQLPTTDHTTQRRENFRHGGAQGNSTRLVKYPDLPTEPVHGYLEPTATAPREDNPFTRRKTASARMPQTDQSRILPPPGRALYIAIPEEPERDDSQSPPTRP